MNTHSEFEETKEEEKCMSMLEKTLWSVGAVAVVAGVSLLTIFTLGGCDTEVVDCD